jgi:hypothetical protein
MQNRFHQHKSDIKPAVHSGTKWLYENSSVRKRSAAFSSAKQNALLNGITDCNESYVGWQNDVQHKIKELPVQEFIDQNVPDVLDRDRGSKRTQRNSHKMAFTRIIVSVELSNYKYYWPHKTILIRWR